MADDDEVLPDEAEVGAPGEGAEGSDTGEADGDEGDLSAVESDAASGEDAGPQHGRATGQTDETERPVLSRGARRVQEVTNERNALRDEIAAMRAEREAERQRQAAYDQQYTQQQWNERWAVMTPEEKIEHIASQGQQYVQQQQQQMALQMQLMRDQMSFEAKASVNPVYARHKDEVEREFQARLQRGQGRFREDILIEIMGRKALDTAGKSTASARKAGQKKIEAQTTRPSSNKGDAVSSRGKSGDTAEKRLAGVEI